MRGQPPRPNLRQGRSLWEEDGVLALREYSSKTIGVFCIYVTRLWLRLTYLWPHYEIGQAIIFLPCGFFFLSSLNLSRRRLDVCHTSTHGVALVQI